MFSQFFIQKKQGNTTVQIQQKLNNKFKTQINLKKSQGVQMSQSQTNVVLNYNNDQQVIDEDKTPQQPKRYKNLKINTNLPKQTTKKHTKCLTPDQVEIQNQIKNMKSNLLTKSLKSQKSSNRSHQNLNSFKSNRDSQVSTAHNSKNNYTSSINFKKLQVSDQLIYYAKINDGIRLQEQLQQNLFNINVVDQSNFNCLHYAIQNQNLQIFESLIQKDINVNQLTNCNQSALILAVENLSNNQNSDIMQIINQLLKKDIKINQQDNYKNTALHYTVINNNQELIKLILQQPKIKINLKNFEGKTALQLSNDIETINIFKQYSLCNQDQSKNIQVIGKIGQGVFGQVYLIKLLENDKYYAMKILQKKQIQQQNLIQYVKAEIDIMKKVKNPFIVDIKMAFQNSSKLYIVMRFCKGGDLGSMLQKYNKFSEEQTKFYLCEIILALEELHKNNIIYRDLKPQNIVLDGQGHCQLTDFGLSKLGIDNKIQATFSFCGSIAYLAPEMLQKKGHGKCLDWYLLGVLMYEMLMGIPPFYHDDQQQLLQNIVDQPLKIPNYLSNDCQSLLKQLLQKDPNERLGSKNGSLDIKSHNFFKNIDWKKIYQKQYDLNKLFNIKISDKVNINNKDNQQVFKDIQDKKLYPFIENWNFKN